MLASFEEVGNLQRQQGRKPKEMKENLGAK